MTASPPNSRKVRGSSVKVFEISLGIVLVLVASVFLLTPMTHITYLLLDFGGYQFYKPVSMAEYTAADWVQRGLQFLTLVIGVTFAGDGIRRGLSAKRR